LRPGTELKAFCPDHGTFAVYFPFFLEGEQTLRMESNVAHCPRCGRPSLLEEGYFRFAKSVKLEVERANITKKSAERFIRKARKQKNAIDFLESIEKTDRSLEALVKQIRSENNPDRAIAIAGLVLALALGLPGAIEDYKTVLSPKEFETTQKAIQEPSETYDDEGDSKPDYPAEEQPSKDGKQENNGQPNEGWDDVHDV